MRKKVQLIAVPFETEKLEAGMYWMHYNFLHLNENYLYQLDENDLENSALQEELSGKGKSVAKVIKLYLVSDEIMEDGAEYYSKESIYGSNGQGNIIFTYDKRINYSTDFGHTLDFKKVIAKPHEIKNAVTSEYSVSFNEDTFRDICVDDLQEILENNGECEIEMEEHIDSITMGGLRFDGDDGRGPRAISTPYFRPKLLNFQIIIHKNITSKELIYTETQAKNLLLRGIFEYNNALIAAEKSSKDWPSKVNFDIESWWENNKQSFLK